MSYLVHVQRYTGEVGSTTVFEREVTRKAEARKLFMQQARQYQTDPDVCVDLSVPTGRGPHLTFTVIAAKYRRSDMIALSPRYF